MMSRSLPILDMLDHRPGDNHAERPERLRAVIDALDDDATLDLETLEAPMVDLADLALVHPQGFIDTIWPPRPAAADTPWTPTPCCRPAA
jgi:acetoin utilization deacetylase AcuC-like enzyme